MLVMSDIDGVVADSFPFVAKYLLDSDSPDWDGFFRSTPETNPIEATVEILQCLREAGHAIVFMTGRPESNRHLVKSWLEKHLWVVGQTELLMRKSGDGRPGSAIKAEWIRSMMPDFIIDDEPDAVKAAANCGCTVLQIHGFRNEAPTDRIPPAEVKE